MSATKHDDADLIEAVALAIRNAPNGIDGDSIATALDESMLLSPFDRSDSDKLIMTICRSAAKEAIAMMRTLATPEAVELVRRLRDALSPLARIADVCIQRPEMGLWSSECNFKGSVRLIVEDAQRAKQALTEATEFLQENER